MRNDDSIDSDTEIARPARQGDSIAASEQRHRKLVEITPDAVLVHRGGRVVFVNSAFLRLVGADDVCDVLGRSPLDFVDASSQDAVRRNIATLEKPDASVPQQEERLLRLDGSTVDVEAVACSFVDDEGPAILVILRDVTARKAIERQLRHAQKLEAVGRLTGGVAHDFNNLLGVIIGNLEAAQARIGDDPRLRRAVDLAMTAAERGAELTQRLLAFGRNQPLQVGPIDLNELVAGMQELLQHLLSEDIEVETVLEPGLWQAVGDESQIENCVLNLSVNARDAMPAGGLVTIETANCRIGRALPSRKPDLPPGDYVALAMTDTGTGMPRDVLERAFEPFFTTKDNGRGSGLGLSTVYGVVRQLGGDVAIVSEVGQGTTVRLYLPRAQTLAMPFVERMPDSGELPWGSETILVVEDDPALREVVISQLRQYGYRVMAAPDGPSAMRIIGSDQPIDLLLTDVVMPNGMTGQQLAERALQCRAALRVLFTSGYPKGVIHANGLLKLGVPLLRKPYKQLDLARAVRRQLDRPADPVAAALKIG